jgi:hypothetical protein
MSAEPPQISVVVIAGLQRERAEHCLASILSQKGLEEAEVLLFDTLKNGQPFLPRLDHPRIRKIEIKQPLTFNEIRAHAVTVAHGEIIAFLEDHALARQGWLQALLEDFHGQYSGVGGVPEILNPGRGVSDAATLLNYLDFSFVVNKTEAKALPGHNSAYRRDVLLSFGDQLPVLLSNEILLNWKMADAGHKMLIDPAVAFGHLNEEDFSILARSYYYWNRCFGHNRSLVYRWPRSRRLLQAIATPVVPLLRCNRMLMTLLRSDRAAVPIFLRNLWAIILIEYIAALGLAVGCLFGIGDAALRFSEYEFHYTGEPQKSAAA